MNTPGSPGALYKSRRQAGQILAARLHIYIDHDPIILALPRGGVPVGYEVARALGAPLDVLIVSKIGAPENKDMALGAVANESAKRWVANQEMLDYFNPPAGWFEAERDRQVDNIERRKYLYGSHDYSLSLTGRTVIVVDDGVETGSTARVALVALAEVAPARLVWATPVGPVNIIDSLSALADDVICLATPNSVKRIGMYYQDFPMVSDGDVVSLLALCRVGSNV
ncbi:phosphoribosyltransferase [Pseudomonas asuensis]|uniref:Phosphoribosyltransferase n=1 Tax=Pseudomonas asuensis TaxID=1825787 RepID=A0ABQ2H0X2_9PSED|nr:phosphoribosyltransferase family protein [Pseudomonas asuensis]GGM21085.1 phosphoribosyltransferase [Pseudomonas asuensis]